MATALLHDIGHGPFSHTLEHELIRDFEHEDMSRAIMVSLNERFEGALEADPQLAGARVGLAQMQAVQGRTREALATLSGVEPPTVESVLVTGTTLWGEGEREGACDRFRRVMTLDPRNVNLLLGLGRYLEGCGEPALATEAFQRVLTRQSGHPGAVEALRRLSRPGAM